MPFKPDQTCVRLYSQTQKCDYPCKLKTTKGWFGKSKTECRFDDPSQVAASQNKFANHNRLVSRQNKFANHNRLVSRHFASQPSTADLCEDEVVRKSQYDSRGYGYDQFKQRTSSPQRLAHIMSEMPSCRKMSAHQQAEILKRLERSKISVGGNTGTFGSRTQEAPERYSNVSMPRRRAREDPGPDRTSSMLNF